MDCRVQTLARETLINRFVAWRSLKVHATVTTNRNVRTLKRGRNIQDAAVSRRIFINNESLPCFHITYAPLPPLSHLCNRLNRSHLFETGIFERTTNSLHVLESQILLCFSCISLSRDLLRSKFAAVITFTYLCKVWLNCVHNGHHDHRFDDKRAFME